MATLGFPTNAQPFLGSGGLISQVWYQFLQLLYQRTGGVQGSGTVQTGSLVPAAGGTLDGYLPCDGSAVSRTTYSALFAYLGTTWGAGDGSTTFNVPDLRGRTLIGAGGGYTLGSTGGAASVTLTTGQLPAHSHPVTDPGHSHTITDPGHVHASVVAASDVTTGIIAGGVSAGNTSTAMTGITGTNTASTGITTGNTGSGTAVPTLPPYGVILWQIKT